MTKYIGGRETSIKIKYHSAFGELPEFPKPANSDACDVIQYIDTFESRSENNNLPIETEKTEEMPRGTVRAAPV